MITNLPYIESSIPNIVTTLINAESTIICEERKKYSEEKAKCVCDISKGYYYLFNYNLDYNNRCYKKNELPKNVYLNPITQSFELCYKTCATCNEGGTSINHNCLTCTYNYIKEPKKNSSNCVVDCKYLYYYDSSNQYSCTEDEQCPNDASLIVRIKNKCVNKCSSDDTNKYQYNGECLSSCPINTEAKNYNICQISDIINCSTSDYFLNLDENINQENVKLVAKNYADEFYYTMNHISRFLSENFTMVLYKNSSCVEALNLNNTKIEYDSCIQQLKEDNNIKENEEIIVAVIDIISDNNPITSFGFFNADNGEKLNASKSCSDKNVIMYENILNLLNDPNALKLLQEQNINIFDLGDSFYHDICFHFNSPNGKDATLQDRIKTFYPNVTLCDENCRNKGVNISTMKAECECTFQDLLSNNIFNNDLFGDNVLIQEALEELMEMISNLNLEVLTCYKDVFNFQYFKKNVGGFITLLIIILQIVCYVYYYLVSNKYLIRYMYSLTEEYITAKKKNNIIKKNPPKKNAKGNNHNKSTKKAKKDSEERNESKVNNSKKR